MTELLDLLTVSRAELKHSLRAVILRHTGRGNAITAGALAEMFGFKEDRANRKCIEEMIDDEFPVCSVTEPPAGYFFPASVEEARIYSKALQSRAVMIFLRRRHIVKNTSRWYERARQLELV